MAEKVLLVENESLIRNNVSQFLSAKGYEISEANNGAEALEILATDGGFNLVITDLAMPGVVDGIRLVELIHARWPHIPAVLVTGYLSVHARNIILGKRAEVMTKPLKLEELLSTVKRILEKRAEHT